MLPQANWGAVWRRGPGLCFFTSLVHAARARSRVRIWLNLAQRF